MKKTYSYWLLIFGGLLLQTACFNGYSSWEKDVTVNQIDFEKLRYALDGKDTIAIIGYLKTPGLIEDYPCAADWVHFTKDWKLELLRLNKSMVINNFEYSKDCWIRFKAKDHSVICVFPDDIIIQDYECRGGGGASGIQTGFYENGRLKYFYSHEDLQIGEVLCNGGVFSIIGLHQDGSLMECTLARDATINGKIYESGEHIYIDADGIVKVL